MNLSNAAAQLSGVVKPVRPVLREDNVNLAQLEQALLCMVLAVHVASMTASNDPAGAEAYWTSGYKKTREATIVSVSKRIYSDFSQHLSVNFLAFLTLRAIMWIQKTPAIAFAFTTIASEINSR